MSEETTAVATETITVGGELNVEDLFAQRDRLGQQVITNFNALTEREKLLNGRRQARRTFCDDRGLNLERAVEFAKERANQAAGIPTLDTSKLTAEGNFVVKVATERTQNGFTMEELPDLAQKAGMGDMSTKDARQPLLQAVLSLDQQGFLKKADFKRDNKTVYLIATVTQNG